MYSAISHSNDPSRCGFLSPEGALAGTFIKKSCMPTCIDFPQGRVIVLVADQSRLIAHVGSNITSSTYCPPLLNPASSAPLHIGYPLRGKVVEIAPQLEIKFASMIYSFIITLILSKQFGESCLAKPEQTGMQMGTTTVEEMQGLHSFILPGFLLLFQNQGGKEFQKSLKESYIAFTEQQIDALVEACEQFSQDSDFESEEANRELLDLLAFTHCQPTNPSIGLREERGANRGGNRKRDIYCTFSRYKKLLNALNNRVDDLIGQLIEGTPEERGASLLNCVKCGNRARRFLRKNREYILRDCSAAPLPPFDTTHLYTALNRVDVLPRRLNEWDVQFEAVLRGKCWELLLKVCEKNSDIASIATLFFGELTAFLSSSEGSIKNSLAAYEDTLAAYKELSEREFELLHLIKNEEFPEALKKLLQIIKLVGSLDKGLMSSRQIVIISLKNIANGILVENSGKKECIINTFKGIEPPAAAASGWNDFAESKRLKELKGSREAIENFEALCTEPNIREKRGLQEYLRSIAAKEIAEKCTPSFLSGHLERLINAPAGGEELEKLPLYLMLLASSEESVALKSKFQLMKLSNSLFNGYIKHLQVLPPCELTEGEALFLKAFDFEEIAVKLVTYHPAMKYFSPFPLSDSLLRTNLYELDTLLAARGKIMEAIENLKSKKRRASQKNKKKLPHFKKLLRQRWIEMRRNQKAIGDICGKVCADLVRLKKSREEFSGQQVMRKRNHPPREHERFLEGKAAKRSLEIDNFLQELPEELCGEEGIDPLTVKKHLKKFIELNEKWPGTFRPESEKSGVGEFRKNLSRALVTKLQQLIPPKGRLSENSRGEITEFLTLHNIPVEAIEHFLESVDSKRSGALIEAIEGVTRCFDAILSPLFSTGECDLDGLLALMKGLRGLYRSEKPLSQEMEMVAKRLQLAVEMREALVNLASDPALPEEDLRPLLDLLQVCEGYHVMNGFFFQSLYSYFSPHIPFNRTHRSIPEALFKLRLFFDANDESGVAKNHFIDAAEKSLAPYRENRMEIVLTGKEPKSLPASIRESRECIEEYNCIYRKVLPLYRDIVEEAMKGDVKSLITSIQLAEMDLPRLFGRDIANAGLARKFIEKLPPAITSTLFSASILSRTNGIYSPKVDGENSHLLALLREPQWENSCIELKGIEGIEKLDALVAGIKEHLLSLMKSEDPGSISCRVELIETNP